MSAIEELYDIMSAKPKEWWLGNQPLAVPDELFTRVWREIENSGRIVTCGDPTLNIPNLLFHGKIVTPA